MGLFSSWFKKTRSQPSSRSLEEYLRNTSSTRLIQEVSQTLGGQQQMPLESEVSFTQFMGSFQELILTKARHEVVEAEYRALQAQSVSWPHRVYSPRLFWDGLEWVCEWGMTDPDSKISGRGESPMQALMNFDLAWVGKRE